MTYLCKKTIFLSILVIGLIISVSPVQATSITFDIDTAFVSAISGFDPKPDPQGSSLTATFDDGDTPGSVTLTLTGDLKEDTIARGWYFNFDDDLDVTLLNFTQQTGTAPDATGISKDENFIPADSGGFFDIEILFPDVEVLVSGGDVFNGNDYAEFLITSTEGIDASSFNFLSFPHGEYGVYSAAGHIQNLDDEYGNPNPELSTWIGTQVPINSTAWLLISGLVGIIGTRRIIRKDI